MILESIDIQNMRSYDSASINFPKGVTLFEGDIGSGKSTVLMCIEFALFGLGSSVAASLLAKKATTGSVTLKFSVDDTPYEVHRVLKKQKDTISQDPSSSYIMSNSVKEMLTPTELKPRILQILNFNEPLSTRAISKIFRYAVFTPQEEMKAILADKNTRLDTIRKAFRIEDYSTAYNNASKLGSEIKHMFEAFAIRFENLKTLQSELQSQRDQVSVLGPALEKLESDKREAELEESSGTKRLDDLRSRHNERMRLEGELAKTDGDIGAEKRLIETYTQRISTNKTELESVNKSLAGLESATCPTPRDPAQISQEIEEFTVIRDEMTRLESKIEIADDHIKTLVQKLDADILKNPALLDESISEKKSTLDKCRAELDAAVQKHNKLNNTRISLEGEYKRLEQAIKDVMGLGKQCQYCGHELTPEHIAKQKEERTVKMNEAKTQLDDTMRLLEDAESSKSDLESRTSDLDRELCRLEDMKPGIDEHEAETSQREYASVRLEELRLKNTIHEEPSFPNDNHDTPISYLTTLRDARMQYDESKKREQDLRTLHDTLQNKIRQDSAATDTSGKRIREMETHRSELDLQVRQMHDIDGDIKQVESALEETQLRIRSIAEEITRNETNLDHCQASIEKLTEQIDQAQKWHDKHAQFSKYHEWITKFFMPTIAEIEKQVLLSIQNTFDDTYRKWYRILVDDPTKDSYIDQEFTPLVSQDGYDQDVENLSGGEKTSISLAYRLTLNSLMRKETESLKSNLLILDEPTDGFSKQQLQKVKTLFDELQSQQIILVSHEKDLESYVEHVFHVSKSNGRSSIHADSPGIL